MREFEEYLEQEKDLNGLKEDMSRREMQKESLDSAVTLLK